MHGLKPPAAMNKMSSIFWVNALSDDFLDGNKENIMCNSKSILIFPPKSTLDYDEYFNYKLAI